MTALLVLPIVVPLLTAALTLTAWRSVSVQRWLSVSGAVVLLAVSLLLLRDVLAIETGVMATQAGGWPAPFGITLVADLLSAVMVALAACVGLAIAVFSVVSTPRSQERLGYYPLLHILMMGICGAFLTGDIFDLYVWFEVMLMASFVLLAMGGSREQTEGALKYVAINLFASALFLTALGLLYPMAGTLNMADLSGVLGAQSPVLVTVLATLFLVAFGIKAALFPLYFWLPASYHTPPAAVAAIFAALLTKVGVYSLLRVFTLLFVTDVGYTHTVILVLSGCTMVAGVLGALVQQDLRRVFSFLLISHIGYITMGLGLFTHLAIAGAIVYTAHHILVKAGLFLICGVIGRVGGTYELRRLGGLYVRRPEMAVLFLIGGFALSGIPPLSGFFPKVALMQAALETGRYTIVGAAILASVLTLYAVARVWSEAFWKAMPRQLERPVLPVAGMLAPIAVLAALTIGMGVYAEPVFRVAFRASEQLLTRTAYIEAVMGARGATPPVPHVSHPERHHILETVPR
jgi:multicomponent Na+:H+ antiporter subunit D